MSIELTHELRREVRRAGSQPVRLIDPDTNAEFVVLPAEVYDRLRRLARAEVIDPSFYEFEEREPPRE